MTQDQMADWLTRPLQMRRGERELCVQVLLFRQNEDGLMERVYVAGPTPTVPVVAVSDGIDWDKDKTFLATPVPLYVNYDEWTSYMRRVAWAKEQIGEGE